jgi:hypothetical protein
MPHSQSVQANEVFAIMPRVLNDKLLASSAKFYDGWRTVSVARSGG